MNTPIRVVVTGGAGLVGMNFAASLEYRNDLDVTFIDKHRRNLGLLASTFPSFRTTWGDLAEEGEWQDELREGDVVIVLHAQITSPTPGAFERNNVVATARLVETARAHGVAYLLHVSSSVLHSRVEDDYVRSKRKQEAIIEASGIRHSIVRPTLMYGWFDPKHLGWLARFMERSPIFPIPGNGRYMRQPFYAQDLCKILDWLVRRRPDATFYDLTGPDRITYVDMIKLIRETKGLRRPLVHVPVAGFRALLELYGKVNSQPPFTKDQLDSLAAGDDFTGVDIREVFGVEPTPFAIGIQETLRDPRYSPVTMFDPET